MKVGSILEVGTEELTRSEWRQLFDELTFVDADGNEVCAYDHRSGDGVVYMPRGAFDLVVKKRKLSVVDNTSRPKLRVLEHVKELDAKGFTGQKKALKAMLECGQGQIRLSTGGGKSTIGCAFIAACGTRTLVLVHTQALLKQWVERAVEEIPGIEVGVIQGKTANIGHLTVATMQTVRDKYLDDERFWRRFGATIIDEGHHAASSSYEWILNECTSFYRFALSASDKRSDGRQLLVRFNVGPVIYRSKFKSQVPIEVQPIFTNFRCSANAMQWQKVVKALVEDEERNKLVAHVVETRARHGNSVLVLSRQIKHLELIAEQFSPAMDGHYAIVTGRLIGRDRDEMIDALRSGELKVILGTQIFEEGIDVPRLNTVALAFPGTDVTTLQKVGRVTRRFEGKKLSLVLDFVDAHVAVLTRQYAQRKHWYKNSARLRVKLPIDERRARNATQEVERIRDRLRKRRQARSR